MKDTEAIENEEKSQAYWYVCVGEGLHRTWEDNRHHNYVGAGQDYKYSNFVKKLKRGDAFYAYKRKAGYVDFGRVLQEAIPIREYVPPGYERPLVELDMKAKRPHENMDNDEKCEWVVPVQWMSAIDAKDAQLYFRDQSGERKRVFANPNVVCKLTNPETLKHLKQVFGLNASDNA